MGVWVHRGSILRQGVAVFWGLVVVVVGVVVVVVGSWLGGVVGCVVALRCPLLLRGPCFDVLAAFTSRSSLTSAGGGCGPSQTQLFGVKEIQFSRVAAEG